MCAIILTSCSKAVNFIVSEDKKGLISQFKQLYQGYNPDDQTNQNLHLESSATGYSSSIVTKSRNNKDDGNSSAIASDWIDSARGSLNDLGRQDKYKFYEEMIEEPIFDSAIDMHLSHALSENTETGLIITVESEDESFKPFASELNTTLMKMINDNITSWAKISAIFGAHYVRPYAESGKGITHIESSWHTLATNIREYERSGALAGYTSEYLKKELNTSIELAPPWALVGLKMPAWRPNLNKEPVSLSGEAYSLYDDAFHRSPIETQNYGTSMLHGSYEPWLDMRDGLKSLRASRQNASRIDRLVTVGMEGLTPHAAAEQLNLVGKQLKGNIDKAKKSYNSRGVMSTIFTTLLPSLAGGKNGINVDSHQTSPDIQHIEDIMFQLKRACSPLGIDPSLLGWGDLMSGGLGDGGFFRNSIQAANRANQLRKGTRLCVHRLIDIHLLYKYNKTFAGKRPYTLKYHSLNTAIEQEKASAMLTKSDYATSVTTVLDMMEAGSLNKSATFKDMIMNDILNLGEDKTANILAELKQASSGSSEGDKSMYESVEVLESMIKRATRQEFNNIMMDEI